MASNTSIETRTPAGAPMLRKTGRTLARLLGVARKIAQNMFGLDERSLALLRIGMGLCLLWVAFNHSCEMRAFYTDEGVLPRAALFNNPGEFLGFSLHFAGGSLPYIATLFVAQMALALMMIVGYRTRIATIGSYLLLLSMQNRQPLLIFGADNALRVGLFWMMFLPLSRRFSLDRLSAPNQTSAYGSYLGLAGVALIVQVCMIYSIGALMKSGPTWHVDYTAVGYALAVETYSRPLGHWLGQFDSLTKALTIITLYLELYGPLLFILPVLSSWGRSIGFVLFAGLQIGFGLCMTMGIFGPVMIALTFAFLPASFWDRFAEPLGRKIASMFGGLAQAGARMRNRYRAGRPRSRSSRSLSIVIALLRDGVVALLMLIMVLWNVGNIPGQPWRLTPRLQTLGYSVGLDQIWDMFAPDPLPIDGWFVIAGRLRNGKTVNLMSGASPVSFDRPASIADSYRSQLWMSYLISLWDSDGYSPEFFAKYLCTTWDEQHSGDEQLRSVEINVMQETLDGVHSRIAPERLVIWTQRF